MLSITSLAPVEEASTTMGEGESGQPHLEEYDRIIVAFSGGKDSMACVLHLLEQGISPERIHLHHHLVDGRESTLMDWPCTEAYCNAIASAMGLQLTFSWRLGGFEREMLRNGDPTAPVSIPYGTERRLIGGNGPAGVRRKFPQVSASLSVRWCSPAVKIGPMDSWINNDPVFTQGKTLVVTGERAEESKSRAHYQRFEPHRADNRNGKRVKRHVDHWRPVHSWKEKEVWKIMERWGVVAHPAYYLGYGRCSCRTCIFSSKDQWATTRKIAPEQFDGIAKYEREFMITIHRSRSVVELADSGTPYDTDPFWVEIANSTSFDIPVFTNDWKLPAGAYGDSCGPQ